jgi:hypothetical protein
MRLVFPQAMNVFVRVLIGPEMPAGAAQSEQRIGFQPASQSPIRVPIHQCINPLPHNHTLARASQNQPCGSVHCLSSLKPLRRSSRVMDATLNL